MSSQRSLIRQFSAKSSSSTVPSPGLENWISLQTLCMTLSASMVFGRFKEHAMQSLYSLDFALIYRC